MSQYDFGLIDPNQKTGTQLATDLNQFRDALHSMHRGAARPEYVKAGMLWVREVSAEQWDVVLHDGVADLTLRSINPTSHQSIAMPIASGGTGASTAAGARTALGIDNATLDQRYVSKTEGVDADTLDGNESAYFLAWGNLTGKPATFPPSGHSHPWSEVTGKPAYASRWPSWNEVTGKPANAVNTGTGQVGTYALLYNTSYSTFAPGQNVAGSLLDYSSTNSNTGASPAGTWRCMGYSGPQERTVYLRTS